MKKLIRISLLTVIALSFPTSAFAACAKLEGVAYGDAPAVSWAGNSNVFWYVQTAFKFLSVRNDDANDRFVIGHPNPSAPVGNGCLFSGTYLRLSTLGFADYLIADTEINSNVVRVGREYGPPKYKGTGTFFIEKTGGIAGSVIRYGEDFRIRGTTGNAWLCVNCSNQAIGLTQNINMAATWRFVK